MYKKGGILINKTEYLLKYKKLLREVKKEMKSNDSEKIKEAKMHISEAKEILKEKLFKLCVLDYVQMAQLERQFKDIEMKYESILSHL